MTGICGWFEMGAQAPGTGDLQAMRRQLVAHGQSSEEVSGERYAVHCLAHLPGHVYRDDSLIVVVDGNPEIESFDDPPESASAGCARRIAGLYRNDNQRFLDDIGGNYAIAVLDLAQSRCELAVDRFGIRPLAYAVIGDLLVFGSTATAVYTHPQVPRGLDHQSLYNYVYFHMIPSPRTVFAGIRKLPPAHRALLSPEKQTVLRHWMPVYGRQRRGKLRGALLPTLGNAVSGMSAHPATGAFLSGGLDSSTVCGLLQQSRDTKARVFTIGFAQDGYDELEYSRLATSHFGLELSDYYITPQDVLSAIPEVAAAYDEPFGNSSAVPTLVCARMAKKAGIEYLLAGDGGDELFAGNERYATQKLFGYYRHMPRWLDKWVMQPVFFRQSVLQQQQGFQHKVRRYIEQANMAMPDRTQNYNLLHLLGADTIFCEDFLSGIDTGEPAQLLRDEYWQDGPPDQLERLLFMDYKFTLADNDIRKVNRMCELAGVQVEYPMLDDGVVDFSNTIPSKVKLKGLHLRDFYKRETAGFLPTAIINKTKHGFGLPFGEWLKLDQGLSAHINGNINSLREREIFRASFIDDLQQRHQTEHAAYYGGLVWVLAMLEEWLQQHQLSV